MSAKLSTLIAESRHIVAFTGAGISTESGIPDFRSPGGLWDKYQPIHFQQFIESEAMRRESWRRKLETDKVLAKAKPNQGHYAIAKLVHSNKIKAVITQNIDGLHQASGVDDDVIIELHGNRTYAKCLDCEKRFSLDAIMENFKKDESLPYCDHCSGVVKTATISFGQAMPADAMLRAENATRECDLFIVLGSSLSVYPAAGFPELAVHQGARLAIINRDPTDLDEMAELVIHREIGATLAAVVEQL